MRSSSTRTSPWCAISSRKLLRAKGQLREAEQELSEALDAVPTYAEATLELSSAAPRRRAGRTRRSIC